MMTKSKNKETSVATVRNHFRTFASFPTPLIFHYPLPLSLDSISLFSQRDSPKRLEDKWRTGVFNVSQLKGGWTIKTSADRHSETDNNNWGHFSYGCSLRTVFLPMKIYCLKECIKGVFSDSSFCLVFYPNFSTKCCHELTQVFLFHGFFVRIFKTREEYGFL